MDKVAFPEGKWRGYHHADYFLSLWELERSPARLIETHQNILD